MIGKGKTLSQDSTIYATRADFCRIFKTHMDRLYLLSFLLTADHAMAEKCFVRGLRGSAKSNSVFKEWAESWARRTIIRKAVQMIKPRLSEASHTSVFIRTTGESVTELPEIIAVAELPAFERFVFVISVLERYSDQECSLLLNCTRGDVIAARTRALQQISTSAELRKKLVTFPADKQPRLRDQLGPALRVVAVSA
jgi:DNA-directed RNA polymerase specialized sigma24 family protein